MASAWWKKKRVVLVGQAHLPTLLCRAFLRFCFLSAAPSQNCDHTYLENRSPSDRNSYRDIFLAYGLVGRIALKNIPLIRWLCSLLHGALVRCSIWAQSVEN